jgi:integrase
MPRKPTGTVTWAGDRYRARITLADGSRPWIDLPAGLTEARAREMAAAAAERARKTNSVHIPKGQEAEATEEQPAGETVQEWSERWVASREAQGLTSVSSDRSRLRTHVLPALGDLELAKVTRQHIEELVEQLDLGVREGEFSWHTARLVWALVSKMFDDAAFSKTRALRVRDDNPAAGVRGPDRGIKKSKAYLYPNELLRLASCERVPLHWRRIYVLAAYLFPRPGELEALMWEDIDLQRGTVHIHRGIDRYRDQEKSTKTGQARRFSIEPQLLPLLRVLHAEASGKGRVVDDMPEVTNLSRRLREHLERAGITRPDLFANDKTRKQITFYDLRATGITWMAVRGDDPLKIKSRAGHTSFTTTEGYIREAEQVRDGFGEVFPRLPTGLVYPTDESSTNRLSEQLGLDKDREILNVSLVGHEGLEPSANGLRVHCSTN